MKKGFIAIFMVIVLLLTFAISGCGQQEPAGTDTSDSQQNDSADGGSDEQDEIRFSWWGSEVRHAATLDAIAIFEEQNPGIKIIPEYQGYDGYQDKMMAQAAARNLPDIYSTLGEWYVELKAADALADMSGMFDVSGHNPQYIEAGTVDDELVGVSISVNGMILMQNRTLLEEYGVELLEEPYTWEDMFDKFVEIYEASNGEVFGISDYSVNGDSMFWPMFQYFGYTYLGHEGAFPFDNDEFLFTEDDVRAYYQIFADYREKNAFAPTEESVINDHSSNSLLVNGRTAFEINYAGTFGNYQDQMLDDLIATPMPVGPNGETGDIARPGILLSIAKNSQHVEEAAKFIDFFTNSPDAALVLGNSRGALPTEVQRAALIEHGEEFMTDIDRKVISVVDKIMEREFHTFYAGPSRNSEFQNIMPELGQAIAYGRMTVEEVAAEMMREKEARSQ